MVLDDEIWPPDKGYGPSLSEKTWIFMKTGGRSSKNDPQNQKMTPSSDFYPPLSDLDPPKSDFRTPENEFGPLKNDILDPLIETISLEFRAILRG